MFCHKYFKMNYLSVLILLMFPINLFAFQHPINMFDSVNKVENLYTSDMAVVSKIIDEQKQCLSYELDNIRFYEGDISTIFMLMLNEKRGRIKCPQNEEFYRVILRDASKVTTETINTVAKVLKLSYSIEEIDTNYLELKVISPSLINNYISFDDNISNNTPDYWHIKGATLDNLAEIIEIRQNTIIECDNTEVSTYDLKFSWEEFSYPIKKLNKLLNDRYGLQLFERRGKVKFHVLKNENN